MKVFARAMLMALLAFASGAAHAEEPLKAKVGVLRLSSSAPVFIAQDKGYFREAGLDIELKFFDAAQPIAVATTSGDVDFGVTAFTAERRRCGAAQPDPHGAKFWRAVFDHRAAGDLAGCAAGDPCG